jgi:hypothetical protein
VALTSGDPAIGIFISPGRGAQREVTSLVGFSAIPCSFARFFPFSLAAQCQSDGVR